MSSTAGRARGRNLKTKLKNLPADIERKISNFTSLCGTQNTPCDAESHAKLTGRLLAYCEDKETAMSRMRSYSRSCFRAVIQSLESDVGDDNVFENGPTTYGMWWLVIKGAVRPYMDDPVPRRGLLYIHAQPWIKNMRVLSLVYNAHDLQTPIRFIDVEYRFDRYNNIHGSYKADSFMGIAFPYPTTVQAIRTMEQASRRFVPTHGGTRLSDVGFQGFSTQKELVLMLYKLLNNETNGPVHRNGSGWDITIHRFPEKNTVLVWSG